MVSNTLDIPLQEILDTLERLRQEHGDSPEYKRLRRQLPEEWPI